MTFKNVINELRLNSVQDIAKALSKILSYDTKYAVTVEKGTYLLKQVVESPLLSESIGCFSVEVSYYDTVVWDDNGISYFEESASRTLLMDNEKILSILKESC